MDILMVPRVSAYKTSKTKKIWRKFVIWLKGTNQISRPSPFWLAMGGLLEVADGMFMAKEALGLTDDTASKKYVL